MAGKKSIIKQNSPSKANANQATQQKPGGKSIPAVNSIQQKPGEDEEAMQRKPAQLVKEDEDWDVAEESDTAGVQISLPTMEKFAEQTNAGLFARRDDVLKMIDAQLQQCIWERQSVYSNEAWENKKQYVGEVRDRSKEAGDRSRKAFKSKLDQLEGLARAWLTHFKDDESSGVARRRASIEALLPAIQAEREMTKEQRDQSVQEKEVKEKAAAEVSARTLFTAEEFKTEAKIWLAIPFTNIGDVVSGLEAFHAIPETPGDDNIRLRKIDLSQKVRSAASAAHSAIIKLKSHAGYEKGHMGFEKDAHKVRQTALRKLEDQCKNYYVYNRTAEEKAAFIKNLRSAT